MNNNDYLCRIIIIMFIKIKTILIIIINKQ